MNKEQAALLAEEFEGLAHGLLEHARYLRGQDPEADHQRLFWSSSTISSGLTAESLLEARERRLRHLDSSILGEPTWDMLLILFKAFKAEACVTIDQVCQSSGTFPSTARRWLAVLEHQGLVDIGAVGEADHDRPIQLSELGKVRMAKVLLDMQDQWLRRGWSFPGMG